jgi:hypothetical protein
VYHGTFSFAAFAGILPGAFAGTFSGTTAGHADD